jgi:acyl-CoA reductase-like NAD-dependent aldehyde dehydrogenase
VSTLELFAGTAQHLYGRSHVVNPAVVSYTLREPVGVVGAIIPWNYPLMMAAWKVAPALAAGNTMVLKPASATPLSAIRLGELALEAGIPAGVLNVVPGPGGEVGEAIATHPGIDKVAFTGETGTGRRIAEAAAKTLKRVSLELGGKSPNIVFADADLDAAVLGSVWAIYYAAGQSCEARSRILVQDEAYDAFASAFAKKTKSLQVGDPLDAETKVGSLISRDHASKVRGFIDIGLEGGGELLAGGDLSLPDGLDAEAFVAPTVIGGVANDARICQEEVFGPGRHPHPLRR